MSNKPFYKQYGKTLKLTGVSEEPLLITIDDKNIRDTKKVEIQELLVEYESTKAKAKREKIENNLKALFENTVARRAKEIEDEKNASEAQKKIIKSKKAKEKVETVSDSIDSAISELENASDITEDKRSRLQKLLDKLSGKNSKTVERQRSGVGREY